MNLARFIPFIVVALLFAPALASAQAVSIPAVSASTQNGIASCNQTGSYAMSVGALGATGGTYVPVYDNSVTLNTGYLVYLECVLRPLVAAEAHQVTYAYDQQALQQYLTGRNGNPYFVQNYGQESFNAYNSGVTAALPSVTGALNSAFQSPLNTALQRNYAIAANAPYLSISCPYSGNLSTVLNGTTNNVLGGISTMLNPACSPYSAYLMAQNQIYANAAATQNAWQTQLGWNNGNYSLTNAAGLVVTPGFLVGQLAGQALTSGQQINQNANDIGQMVNGLFAGLANQILNIAGGGLAGINTSINGQPSYLQQTAAATSQGLGQAVTNTALAILTPALSVEEQYDQIENAMASNLGQTIAQLRGEENACWTAIIQNVCTSSPTPAVNGSGETCTGAGGATLHIATSTEFSQPVVSSQIAPVATAVATNVQNSNQSILAIQSLISGVQNTTDTTAQQNALQTLDALTSQGALHSQNDVNSAQQDQGTVQTAMQTLVTNTTSLWTGYDSNTSANDIAWNGKVPTAGDTNPTDNAWCNVPATTGGTPDSAQQTTINAWVAAWSQ